tara:strand:- start:61 stop:1131 length:1071 start_codon:yes stop_codon:yes gene_type:complete
MLEDSDPKKNNQKNYSPENHNKILWQAICSAILVIISIYLLIFNSFERKNEQTRFSENFSSGENHFWDEWWDTGRPPSWSVDRSFEMEDLWPILEENLQKIFGKKNEEISKDVHEKLKYWLELSEKINLADGQSDSYALIARGLFETREFELALATLIESLAHAKLPAQKSKVFQDLGTVYYYRGYNLQPNGLAQYNLNDVKDSIKSYEEALIYGEDPYLYGNLGWGYYLTGDYSRSISTSLKALSLKPGLNYVRMNLGIAYLRKGNYELAYSTYDSLSKRNTQLEEYEGGIRDLMEIQMESPGKYPFTNFVIGQLYWQQGRKKEAKKVWGKFLTQRFSQSKWKKKVLLFLQEANE